jgi:hypothetical protein
LRTILVEELVAHDLDGVQGGYRSSESSAISDLEDRPTHGGLNFYQRTLCLSLVLELTTDEF